MSHTAKVNSTEIFYRMTC